MLEFKTYLIDKKGYVRYWWYGELKWQGNDGETLFVAIESGAPPSWLKPLGLPAPLAANFRLLEVVR